MAPEPGASAALTASWMTLAASGLVLAASWIALAATGRQPETAGAWSEDEALCPAGEWFARGACVPAEVAFVGPGGTSYVVDAGHPDADDANPGTAARPWRTISRATRPGTLRPGDAVVIRAGTYRESITPRSGGTGPDARITFAAYPGDEVVVSGADPADDGWQRQSDGTWRRPWAGPPMHAYSDDPTFRREMVVVGGRVLRPAVQRSALERGTFWAEGTDEAPRALVASFSRIRAGGVEVAHRTRLFWPEGPDPYAECGDPATPGWLRVVGLTFRHATNRAQWGAFCAGSVGGLVEDVRVEWTNGLGIDVGGRRHTFLRTRADLNGQLGWGGGCHGCLFEETTSVGNNWKGHDPFWEAGGGKWVGTTDSVIRRHYSAHNGGPGIWLDIDNHRNTVEGCLVVGNEVAGIMLEFETTQTLVQHNVVAGTRWRSWSGTGVLSQAASQNAYLHNTVVENGGTGLWLRLDPDRRAPDGDNVVVNNWIVGNATSGEEAREVSVEGTGLAHVRSNRFEGNAYGRLGRDVFRSTFFAYPVPSLPSGLRSDDLARWQDVVDGDRRARLVGERTRVEASDLGPLTAGAPGSGPRPHVQIGADPTRVRARGDWQDAPPAPDWPR